MVHPNANEDFLIAEAYAKINLHLEVLGFRTDGFHELAMVMQSINLSDKLKMKNSEEIFKALQNMIENEIMDQIAPSLGIIIPPEQIEIYIRDVFMPSYNNEESPDPVQIEREFKEIFNNYLTSVGLSEEEYKKFTRWSMLREQMRQYVGETVPTVAEQVYLHRIMILPDDEIDIMKKKYEDGTPFKYIVREFSKDNEEVIRRGGEIGWIPRGIFPEYDYIIFDLAPNLLSIEAQREDKIIRVPFSAMGVTEDEILVRVSGPSGVYVQDHVVLKGKSEGIKIKSDSIFYEIANNHEKFDTLEIFVK